MISFYVLSFIFWQLFLLRWSIVLFTQWLRVGLTSHNLYRLVEAYGRIDAGSRKLARERKKNSSQIFEISFF